MCTIETMILTSLHNVCFTDNIFIQLLCFSHLFLDPAMNERTPRANAGRTKAKVLPHSLFYTCLFGWGQNINTMNMARKTLNWGQRIFQNFGHFKEHGTGEQQRVLHLDQHGKKKQRYSTWLEHLKPKSY